ncbi:YjcZ family sporulation protein [Peribacillus sp. NJ4]|uniref:YjcZ family sporulation protein n=1 Tax=Peribacillus TaxID=2675229 RepID=UPI0025A21AD0|nr:MULTISPECIES: YjcZ family sporulation protein [unclassified Peribacillus]MDM5213049.1 YjcZ family sporulation protein [Peribacillus sp. NJ4]MDM5223424.1 YjcZ family sporulation protein [Peribacillus sp. NJ11]
MSSCGHESSCGCDNGVGGFGGGFAFIVVLFILLIIVGAACFGNGGGHGAVQGYGGFC